MAAAIIISCLQGKSFDDSINHIQKLSNVEPWKIVGPRCDQDLVRWVHTVANGRTIPDSVLRVSAELVSAAERALCGIWSLLLCLMACRTQLARGAKLMLTLRKEWSLRSQCMRLWCMIDLFAVHVIHICLHVLGILSESHVRWKSR